MYQDEIPTELEQGEKYSGKVLRYFLSERSRNDERIILSNQVLHDHFNYKVLSIREQYINRTERGTFQIPTTVTKIYDVARSSD